ncbi:hypothetical protein [Streptomyces endophyticus]|uniref:Uncharacterized protein n=1 Tax=Streptomyces endophyticus TaxID=714166 RepID=A0ABU6F1Y7_9ACTN|nr:hypothetical protein [Streptomyces endophyticus]MEB8338030.1 hypothetical protein [Streptomyces endophyticus]
MNVKLSTAVREIAAPRITSTEFLAARGLPANWRYASPFGRVAAETYRTIYRREPTCAFLLIHGRFRRIAAYRPSEAHVLATAWEIYPRTATLPVLAA